MSGRSRVEAEGENGGRALRAFHGEFWWCVEMRKSAE
jgi:hypothetical protein